LQRDQLTSRRVRRRSHRRSRSSKEFGLRPLYRPVRRRRAALRNAFAAAMAGLNSRVRVSIACSTSIARPLTFFVPNSSGNPFSTSSRIMPNLHLLAAKSLNPQILESELLETEYSHPAPARARCRIFSRAWHRSQAISGTGTPACAGFAAAVARLPTFGDSPPALVAIISE